MRNKRLLRIALSVFIIVLFAGSVALAQSGDDLNWWTVDGGGHTFSTGDSYSLGGSIGQPDAGSMSADDYTLVGGFWAGGQLTYRVFLPIVLKY